MNPRANNIFKWAYLYWIVFSLAFFGIIFNLFGIEPAFEEVLIGIILAITCSRTQIYFLKMNKFRKLTIAKLAKSAFVGTCLGLLPIAVYFKIYRGEFLGLGYILILALVITPFYLLVSFIVQKRVLKHIIRA